MTAKHVENVRTVQGTVQLIDTRGQTRRIPVPSNDPNDPLNFPNWRRYPIFISLCLYGACAFGVVQSASLFFPQMIPDYMQQTRGTFNPANISYLANYPSLCMGVGNFLFVPLSIALGRRPIFLLNSMLMVASLIWAAKSESFASHLGARCLQGLSAGISDCLLPIIVLDVTFIHERGLWMGLYWSVTAIFSDLLLTAVPFVVEHANNNWRMNYYFWLAFAAISLLVAFICLPETLFERPPGVYDGKVVVTDAYGQLRVFDDLDSAVQAGFCQEEGVDQSDLNVSYWKQLSVFGKVSKKSFEQFLNAYAEMAVCIITPGILWSLLVNAFVFGGLVAYSITYSQLLVAPPWSFSFAAVGTIFVGATVGALVSMFATGKSVDVLASFLTRRNGGLREPEFLLPSFIPPAIVGFIALVSYGVVGGHPERYSWVAVHASFALYEYAFIAISTITGVWLGELVPRLSGPAIVYSFTSWIAHEGFQNTHITLGGIFLGLCALGVPLYFVNRYFRAVYTPLLVKVLN
ncbi:hypothetical protein VTN77DRAFT_1425 [Rasamsonia byssochlamydoides]|uniref:uncharacterized protein n=1 Tax=Rasamsonia byssochlamydoides TaxID=89139 RepID=UPI003741F2CA